MNGIDLSGAEGVVALGALLVAGLVPTLVALVVGYWLVRLAVRHGVRDALRDRDVAAVVVPDPGARR